MNQLNKYYILIISSLLFISIFPPLDTVVEGRFPISNTPDLTLPGGHDANQIAIGDLNGDGLEDIVLNCDDKQYKSHLFIHYQTSNNELSQTYDLKLPSGYRCTSLKINDVNDDGLNDLIITSWSAPSHSSGGVTIYYQNESGFSTNNEDMVSLLSGEEYSFPQDVTISDVNNDGLPDITVTIWNDIWIYFQLNNKTFSETPDLVLSPPEKCYSLEVEDIDNNGYQDVLGSYRGELIIFYQFEDQQFSNYSIPIGSDGFIIEDLNNDQVLDICLYESFRESEYDGKIYIFYQRNATFSNTPDMEILGDGWPSCMKSGDLNGDNLTDIAVGYENTDQIQIFFQELNNTFSQEDNITLPSGDLVAEIDIGDLDGDFFNDIASINYRSQNAKVHYQYIYDFDGDGYADSIDMFPKDPTEWFDSDRDGYGDNCDLFPKDPSEWNDTDGDGWGDNRDALPSDPNDWNDTDGDGWGDNNDTFPEDPLEWNDTDGDGWGDNNDTFPEDPLEWNDTDGDGWGDNIDLFPNNSSEWKDTDSDGWGDNGDWYPNDPNSWLLDTDQDGYPDLNDPFPNDPNEWLDSDEDGHGDNSDSFPNDVSAWLDSDDDGLPDFVNHSFATKLVEDLDDDNDKIPDDWEISNGLDPLNSSDSNEDFDGDGYTNYEEFENNTDPNTFDDHPGIRNNNEESEFSILLLAIIIVVFLALLIIIVLIIFFSKRNRELKSSAIPNDVNQVDESNQIINNEKTILVISDVSNDNKESDESYIPSFNERVVPPPISSPFPTKESLVDDLFSSEEIDSVEE